MELQCYRAENLLTGRHSDFERYPPYGGTDRGHSLSVRRGVQVPCPICPIEGRLIMTTTTSWTEDGRRLRIVDTTNEDAWIESDVPIDIAWNR